jgi:hypothetical protein
MLTMQIPAVSNLAEQLALMIPSDLMDQNYAYSFLKDPVLASSTAQAATNEAIDQTCINSACYLSCLGSVEGSLTSMNDANKMVQEVLPPPDTPPEKPTVALVDPQYALSQGPTAMIKPPPSPPAPPAMMQNMPAPTPTMIESFAPVAKSKSAPTIT